MRVARVRVFILCAMCFGIAAAGWAQCPPSLPSQGPALSGPLFPSSNWWNLDISTAPVDPGSAAFINFINNGGKRTLHPDFGGEASPGSVNIYGMPYVVVDGAQPKVAVTFQYAQESDGVDRATGKGIPFYPIPPQAITQQHWIEGGAPGNVDQRSQADRHLLIVDCANRALYELYNVYYSTAQAKWYAGSGAYFDLNASNRRPDGWTSADAAGLAILPGLVRYDEAWNPGIANIGHAFRVTVRSTNGYVFPASHRAGSTLGALPMGARLRLKSSVSGQNPALRTTDPNVQKIFRAMQKYGLIVADNGSDMYISGSFDKRWNNDILNPAFKRLSASDFDVISLGWNPVAPTATLTSVTANPASVVGGTAATGMVSLSGAAPLGGAAIALSSSNPSAAGPGSVTVAAGKTTATFPIASFSVTTLTVAKLYGTYRGVSVTTNFTVSPPPRPVLTGFQVSPTTVLGGATCVGSIALSSPAPTGGVVVGCTSSQPSIVKAPSTVVVPAGAFTKAFAITTTRPRSKTTAQLSVSYAGVSRAVTLTVNR